MLQVQNLIRKKNGFKIPLKLFSWFWDWSLYKCWSKSEQHPLPYILFLSFFNHYICLSVQVTWLDNFECSDLYKVNSVIFTPHCSELWLMKTMKLFVDTIHVVAFCNPIYMYEETSCKDSLKRYVNWHCLIYGSVVSVRCIMTIYKHYTVPYII